MDGRSKLGFTTDSGDRMVKPQGEGGGEEEGIRAHPIGTLAGLGEDRKWVAGGRQERRRHGGAGSQAAAWGRRKGVGERLLEVPGVLFIGKEREERGARPGATAAAQGSGTGSSGRRRWARGGTGMGGGEKG
jgi:hypothetical protein